MGQVGQMEGGKGTTTGKAWTKKVDDISKRIINYLWRNKWVIEQFGKTWKRISIYSIEFWHTYGGDRTQSGRRRTLKLGQWQHEKAKHCIRARQLAAKCANNEIGYNLFSVSGGGPEQFTWNKNDNRSVVVKQSLFVGRWVFECVSACDCVWMWVCVWRGLGWKHPIPWNRAAIKFIVTLLYRIRCNAFPPHQICSEATGVHTVYECRTIEQSNNSSVIDIL